jgi:hypothetical protein
MTLTDSSILSPFPTRQKTKKDHISQHHLRPSQSSAWKGHQYSVHIYRVSHRLGDSTQNFMVMNSLHNCRCAEMSNQNGSFDTYTEMYVRVDLEQEVHNGER